MYCLSALSSPLSSLMKATLGGGEDVAVAPDVPAVDQQVIISVISFIFTIQRVYIIIAHVNTPAVARNTAYDRVFFIKHTDHMQKACTRELVISMIKCP